MIMAIFAAYFAYRKAVATNRSGWKWALIAVGAFIFTQLAVGFLLGIVFFIFISLFKLPSSYFDTYSPIISLISAILSFVSLWVIFRHLDKVPNEDIYTNPPEPPTFN